MYTGAMKNTLLAMTLLGFISLGLTACSSPLDADNVIDQKSFDAAVKTCGDSTECFWDKVFFPKIDDHCKRNNLTEEQCNQLTVNVVLEYGAYMEQSIAEVRSSRKDLEKRIEQYERSK